MKDERLVELLESATRVAEAADSAVMAMEFLQGVIGEEGRIAATITAEEAAEKNPELLALAVRIEASVNRLQEMM